MLACGVVGQTRGLPREGRRVDLLAPRGASSGLSIFPQSGECRFYAEALIIARPAGGSGDRSQSLQILWHRISLGGCTVLRRLGLRIGRAGRVR